VVKCGALPEGTLESELFGHEAGAFTGARYRHKGKFEIAQGGTIFLDEVGEVSPKVQVELLRILEEKNVTRLGGSVAVPVDFRVVAATNQDLHARVKAGSFREDLYWRLNVFLIEVPPLRERRDDIPLLAEHFLARFAAATNRKGLAFAPEALAAIEGYAWPGNVRELQNAVERAVVVAAGPLIEAAHLPLRVIDAQPGPAPGSLADMERAHIRAVLARTEWNISHAAHVLDVDRTTLYNKIRRYGLERPSSGSG
jgi:DNA-binding NtrC family response regulator